MTGNGPATVLIVDDEEDLVKLYASYLSDEYDVRTAGGGREALERLDPSVEVVLLDRRMPELSGDEVLRELRDRGFDCHVVMVTAVDPDVTIVELEFDDYLVKPVTGEDLRDAVERMLARRDHERQLREALSFASTMATLESKMSIEELERSDAYAELEAEFERLRRQFEEAEGSEPELYRELTAQKLRGLLESSEW